MDLVITPFPTTTFTSATTATATAATAPRTTYYEFEDYDYFGYFITNKYVKSYWTAFYILCLYWGFFWFCRHIFGDGSYHMFNRQEAVHNLESDDQRRNTTSRRIGRQLLWTNSSSTAIDIFVSCLLFVVKWIEKRSHRQYILDKIESSL